MRAYIQILGTLSSVSKGLLFLALESEDGIPPLTTSEVEGSSEGTDVIVRCTLHDEIHDPREGLTSEDCMTLIERVANLLTEAATQGRAVRILVSYDRHPHLIAERASPGAKALAA